MKLEIRNKQIYIDTFYKAFILERFQKDPKSSHKEIYSAYTDFIRAKNDRKELKNH